MAPFDFWGPAPHPSFRGLLEPAGAPLPLAHRPLAPTSSAHTLSPLSPLPTGGCPLLPPPPRKKTYTKRLPIGCCLPT